MLLILYEQGTVPLAATVVVLMPLDSPRVPKMTLLTLSAPTLPTRASLLQSKFDTMCWFKLKANRTDTSPSLVCLKVPRMRSWQRP